ncbi:MAG: hypothetical protein K2Y08_04330 [Alphaproteobacteria bacterium]|jgi:hypothetical protein|nr:hypothetical protein [Alphaproteobacteria bacterium]
MTKIVHSALSFTLLTMFFIGCSSFSSSDSPCMKTVLVSTLSRTSLHSVREEDTRSVAISDFKAGCGGSSADLPGRQGEIGINMTLTAPESIRSKVKAHKVALPIFIALLDKDDNVLDRRDERIEITITEDSLKHTYKTSYRPPAGIDVGSENHRILVGLNGNAVAAHSFSGHSSAAKKSLPKKGS